MTTIRRLTLLALAAAPVLTAIPAAAQTQRPAGAPCLTKAAELKERVAELNAPDPMRRVAMFNEMLTSCDPAQREIAYERGFASTEQAVRALTLRAKLRDAKMLILELAAPDGDQQAALAVKQHGGGQVDLPITAYDADKGELKIGNGYVSRVSGTLLNLNYGYCKGVLQLAEGTVLAGTVNCSNIPLRGTIRL